MYIKTNISRRGFSTFLLPGSYRLRRLFCPSSLIEVLIYIREREKKEKKRLIQPILNVNISLYSGLSPYETAKMYFKLKTTTTNTYKKTRETCQLHRSLRRKIRRHFPLQHIEF